MCILRFEMPRIEWLMFVSALFGRGGIRYVPERSGRRTAVGDQVSMFHFIGHLFVVSSDLPRVR
jgi:hypothetical protein